MRAFASGYYNNLCALYDYLGIRYHAQPFLFDLAAPANATSNGSRDASYFVYASNLHQFAPRPASVGRLRHVGELVYLVFSYVWFLLCCLYVYPRGGETLHEYLHRTRIPRHFVTSYLLPLMSSVTTCPHPTLLGFPATDIIEYKRRTLSSPHLRVSDGVRQVQDRLVKDIPYQLNATVTAVEPCDDGVRVSWAQGNGSDRKTHADYFDNVILAVTPDVVGRIFQPLRHHMSQIPTTTVESFVHTDTRVMGQTDTQRVKGSETQLIHIHTSTDAAQKTESHYFQPCGVIVTTCPFSPIDPSLVLHSSKFTRVLRNPDSQKIVNAVFRATPDLYSEKSAPLWRNGDDNVWLVGGWCWDGMVLLEGCVVSAMRVAHALDVEIPW